MIPDGERRDSRRADRESRSYGKQYGYAPHLLSGYRDEGGKEPPDGQSVRDGHAVARPQKTNNRRRNEK